MKEMLADFKAFSDETRLRILTLLEGGERCVCEIVAALQMDQPRISFHLKVLKKAGIVKERKEERWIPLFHPGRRHVGTLPAAGRMGKTQR